MGGAAASTHDLIRLREPMAVQLEGRVPSWVELALRCTPWVVVRRGRRRDDFLPVGVRGATRADRCAAWVSLANIAEQCSPEELWDSVANGPTRWSHLPDSSQVVPAVAAAVRIDETLATQLGYRQTLPAGT